MSLETVVPSEKEDLLSDIFLNIFRLNGRLQEHGDRLVAPLGLTSARWQTLGAVALAKEPPTAPIIAGAMGLTRQGVRQQLVALVADGFLSRWPNPRHERSPVYELTALRRQAFMPVRSPHGRWADGLMAGFPIKTLRQMALGLNELEGRFSGRRSDLTNELEHD